MSQPTTIDPVEILEARFIEAIRAALPDLEGEPQAMIAPGRNPEFGDFQCNAAMGLAKRVGMKPRDVALKIVEAADLSGIAEPLTQESIAGPGFINIRLAPDALTRLLTELDGPDLGLPAPDQPETVVVDLCGVNLAKQMHVGHLRSTALGDAVARLIERCGATVIRQSHMGDWGLPIAMVVQRLIEEEDAGEDLSALTLERLNELYKRAQADCQRELKAVSLIEKVGGHPKAEAELDARNTAATEAFERAKQRLVLLQSGDERSKATWQRAYDVTMAACLETCDRLHADVRDEHMAGESTYADELASVVADLESRGVAEESDGALVVRVDGIKEPCLIRKRDGGFLYATTDLAAIRRRVGQFGASRVVYCVDARQGLHFRQVFGAAERAGYTRLPDGSHASLEHAAFGTVLGEDNKPFKTRSGETVRLSDLIDEACARALVAVGEKNPDMAEDERRALAERVGVAAVKYADMSAERIKDYVFSFDRMLAFEGNTGPYLLYALVRVRSILRKGEEAGQTPGSSFVPTAPEEKTLSLELLRYPRVVRAAAEAAEPSRLAGYLYDLAVSFSKFFEACPVLRADDDATRAARLRLTALTGRVLADGLETLGMPSVERM